MIFQYTIDKVLDGTKSRTSRLKKPGQWLDEWFNVDSADPDKLHKAVVCSKLKAVYETGRDYAAQPGRGKFAECRILVKDLREEDARDISDADVLAEGFAYRVEFLDLWCRMHDKVWYGEYLKCVPLHAHMPSPVVLPDFYAALQGRPAAGHYGIWAIFFEVCK